MGSTTELADGSGNVTAGYGYDVFGGIRTQSGSSPNYWLFTGEQRDGDSGMYYLRARYYDPSIGRFLSQDPLPAGHPYAYAKNNPIGLIDPSGLQAAAVAGTATVTCAAGAAASAGTICVVGVVAVTGVVIYSTCVVGDTCDALGGVILDAGKGVIGIGETIIDGVTDLGGKVTGLFKSDNKAKWRNQYEGLLNQAQIHVAKVESDPCNTYARPGWENSIRTYIRDANKAAKKANLVPIPEYRPEDIPCTDFYVPLPPYWFDRPKE